MSQLVAKIILLLTNNTLESTTVLEQNRPFFVPSTSLNSSISLEASQETKKEFNVQESMVDIFPTLTADTHDKMESEKFVKWGFEYCCDGNRFVLQESHLSGFTIQRQNLEFASALKTDDAQNLANRTSNMNSKNSNSLQADDLECSKVKGVSLDYLFESKNILINKFMLLKVFFFFFTIV